MKVIVSAGGRFHAVQLAYQLYKRGLLSKLLTGGYIQSDSLPPTVVHRHYLTEFLDRVSYRLPLYSFIDQQQWYRTKDAFFERWAAKKLFRIGQADIFVGWANYWGNSIDVIRRTGAKIVLESGSCHIKEQQQLLVQEYEQFGIKQQPIAPAIIDKVLKEYDAADYIMTPASHVVESFVRHGVDAQKVLKVPYGVDVNRFVPKLVFDRNKKFRVLFVGSVGLQKGMHYLLEAWAKAALPVGQSELCIVGSIEPIFKQLMPQLPLLNNVQYVGPVAQTVLPAWYTSADLFVLPSIQEGLAMVQAEAMASGVPVLCSEHTGGAELIEEGKCGFIVPIKNAHALAEKIAWCYEHRELAYAMGQEAAKKSALHTWDHYADHVVATYQWMLEG